MLIDRDAVDWVSDTSLTQKYQNDGRRKTTAKCGRYVDIGYALYAKERTCLNWRGWRRVIEHGAHASYAVDLEPQLEERRTQICDLLCVSRY